MTQDEYIASLEAAVKVLRSAVRRLASSPQAIQFNTLIAEFALEQTSPETLKRPQ